MLSRSVTRTCFYYIELDVKIHAACLEGGIDKKLKTEIVTLKEGNVK
jgi:hypothetical protein